MKKTKFKVGDKVYKLSSVSHKLDKKSVWTVIKVTENANSQSGIILDVEIPKCPHCGAQRRTMLGYDSDWYVKVN